MYVMILNWKLHTNKQKKKNRFNTEYFTWKREMSYIYIWKQREESENLTKHSEHYEIAIMKL